jgi:putative aldouronate transport system substrate-binding protein
MKSFFFVLFCVVLAGFPVFGGASKDSAPSAGGRPTKIEILRSGSNLPSPDKDLILQALNKRLNMDINLSAISGTDYQTQINTRLAAGSPPDLFGLYKETLREFGTKRLLLDLTEPYKNELKPVADYLGENKENGLLNGRYLGITTNSSFGYFLDFIRQDWLDKLGLKVPATVDEFFTVAQAFTTRDPDGNGKNDTYGITGQGINTFASIFSAYGVAMESGPLAVYVKNGQLVSTVTDPDIVKAITAAKRFIDAGVVEPEILANKSVDIIRDKALQNKAGIVRQQWSDLLKDEFVKLAQSTIPDAKWTWIHGLKDNNDNTQNGSFASGPQFMFGMPAVITKTPEKQAAVFKLLNYEASQEGALLVQQGFEGKNYRIANGQIESIDTTDIPHLWLWQFIGRDEMSYLMIRFPRQKEVIQFAANEPRIIVQNNFIDYPAGYVAADATTFAEEELIKFLYGQRPLSEYSDFVNTLTTVYNFKSYMDGAKIQLTARGLLK